MSHLLHTLDPSKSHSTLVPSENNKQSRDQCSIESIDSRQTHSSTASIPQLELQPLYPRAYRTRPFPSHCNHDILSEESSLQSSSASLSGSSESRTSFSSITFTNHNDLLEANEVKLSNPCSTISKHAISDISASGFSPFLFTADVAIKQAVVVTPSLSFDGFDSMKKNTISADILPTNFAGYVPQNEMPKLTPAQAATTAAPPPTIPQDLDSKTAFTSIPTNEQQQMTNNQTNIIALTKIVGKKCNPFSDYVSIQRGVLETKLSTLCTTATTHSTLSKQIPVFPAKNTNKQPLHPQQNLHSDHLQLNARRLVRPFNTNDRSKKQPANIENKESMHPQPAIDKHHHVSHYESTEFLKIPKQQQLQQQRILPVRAWEDLMNASSNKVEQTAYETANKRAGVSHAKITAFSLNDTHNSAGAHAFDHNNFNANNLTAQNNSTAFELETRSETSSSTLGSPTVKSSSSTASINSSSTHYSTNANNIIHPTAIPLIYLYSNPCVSSPKMSVKDIVAASGVSDHAKKQTNTIPATTNSASPNELELFVKQEHHQQQEYAKQQCYGDDFGSSNNSSSNEKDSSRYTPAHENELQQTQKKGKARNSVAFTLTRTNSLIVKPTSMPAAILPPPPTLPLSNNQAKSNAPSKPLKQLPQQQQKLQQQYEDNSQSSTLIIKKKIAQPFMPWNALIAKKHLESIEEKNRINGKRNPAPSQQRENLIQANEDLGITSHLAQLKRSIPLKPLQSNNLITESTKNPPNYQSQQYVSAMDKSDFGRIVNKLYKNFASKPKGIRQ